MTESKWIELARQACRNAGIETSHIDIITTWEHTFSDNDLLRNNAVFRLGDRLILKLYGTDAARHFRVESTLLETLVDVVPAPQLVAHGQLDTGRPYLLMTEVKGKTLQDAWSSLSLPQLMKIARQIGEITADLHRCPTDALASVEGLVGGRLQIIAEEQAKRTAEILAMEHLAPRHRDELLEYTQAAAIRLLNDPAVLTHADLSHAHIFVDTRGGEPYVSGWIDWAEAMLGPAEWDLAFHWFWTFSRNEEAMEACLDAYYAGKPRPQDLGRRCFRAHYFTFSMTEVWDYLWGNDQGRPALKHRANESGGHDSILVAMMTDLFPPEVFGSSR